MTLFAKSFVWSVVAFIGLTGTGVLAQTPNMGQNSGPYLAGRVALLGQDFVTAAAQFDAALTQGADDISLLADAVYVHALLGQWDRAAMLTPQGAGAAGARDVIDLPLFVDAMRRDDVQAVADLLASGQTAGQFVDDLIAAWAAFDAGDMRAAVQLFEMAAEIEGLSGIAYQHLAYARAAVGDFAGADRILSGEEFGPLFPSERLGRAHALILHQLGRYEDAAQVLSFFTGAVADPSLVMFENRLSQRNTAAPYDFIVTAQQGIADVFFVVAAALDAQDAPGSLAILYAQAAVGVDPTHQDARLLLAQLWQQRDQSDLAQRAYESIPNQSDHYIEAQMGLAELLFDTGDERRALAISAALVRDYPDLSAAYVIHGDLMRRADQCGGAIAAYSRAIDMRDATQRSTAPLLFLRAVCHDHVGDWAAAETDLRAALDLIPDDPRFLNFLGYGLVEQRRNLDEALGMIERAVEQRPTSGAIVDSLAWVLYRLGRFDDAVDPMERAVTLEPTDPIINDHLGDVYWMVGRRNEARFQWQRALSFDPTPEDAARIRLKLELGLDAVLRSEGGVGAVE